LRLVTNDRTHGAFPAPAATREPLGVHERLPGYAPTPLHEVADLAEQFGVARVLLKDESERCGLPAFKIMGAAWAVHEALVAHRGAPFAEWETLAELGRQVEGDLTLVAATDGNHGRAVARMAALLGLRSRILVPRDMVAARIDAIASEGAEVTVVDGSYDDAVAASSRLADERTLVVSDTAWDGYEAIPRAVIAGYSTILWEVDDQLAGTSPPDAVFVPVGVGAFAAAVATHVAHAWGAAEPRLITVEPDSANCVQVSIEAGEMVTLEGEQTSIMAGLNCAVPSPLAWPLLAGRVDAAVSIGDDVAREGMRTLAALGIVGGECAGGALGAATALLADPESRETLRISPSASVLVFLTEGATDPAGYREIVGREPESVL
jgi:diaminopropionate ammonia-lyase